MGPLECKIVALLRALLEMKLLAMIHFCNYLKILALVLSYLLLGKMNARSIEVWKAQESERIKAEQLTVGLTTRFRLAEKATGYD